MEEFCQFNQLQNAELEMLSVFSVSVSFSYSCSLGFDENETET
eukprot:COSAG01_NODE_48262_length_382_cov_19.501767_1_plen_42_part_01